MRQQPLVHGPYVTMAKAAEALGITYTEARQLGRLGVIVAVRTAQGWFVRLDPDPDLQDDPNVC